MASKLDQVKWDNLESENQIFVLRILNEAWQERIAVGGTDRLGVFYATRNRQFFPFPTGSTTEEDVTTLDSTLDPAAGLVGWPAVSGLFEIDLGAICRQYVNQEKYDAYIGTDPAVMRFLDIRMSADELHAIVKASDMDLFGDIEDTVWPNMEYLDEASLAFWYQALTHLNWTVVEADSVKNDTVDDSPYYTKDRILSTDINNGFTVTAHEEYFGVPTGVGGTTTFARNVRLGTHSIDGIKQSDLILNRDSQYEGPTANPEVTNFTKAYGWIHVRDQTKIINDTFTVAGESLTHTSSANANMLTVLRAMVQGFSHPDITAHDYPNDGLIVFYHKDGGAVGNGYQLSYDGDAKNGSISGGNFTGGGDFPQGWGSFGTQGFSGAGSRNIGFTRSDTMGLFPTTSVYPESDVYNPFSEYTGGGGAGWRGLRPSEGIDLTRDNMLNVLKITFTEPASSGFIGGETLFPEHVATFEPDGKTRFDQFDNGEHVFSLHRFYVNWSLPIFKIDSSVFRAQHPKFTGKPQAYKRLEVTATGYGGDGNTQQSDIAPSFEPFNNKIIVGLVEGGGRSGVYEVLDMPFTDEGNVRTLNLFSPAQLSNLNSGISESAMEGLRGNMGVSRQQIVLENWNLEGGFDYYTPVLDDEEE